MTTGDPATLSLERAWSRYEAIRDRLPAPRPGNTSESVTDLLSIADHFDGFLFDSFGVLNVGDTAIPGANACLDALRAQGKAIRILTNAASYTGDAALAKYERLGVNVTRSEIISSRDVTLAHLDESKAGVDWAAICAAEDRFEDRGPHRIHDLLEDHNWDAAEGFLFFSSERWNMDLQDRLIASLSRRARPVIVGNPDLVAPREVGLTLEPGFYAHDLQDRTGIAVRLYGKPYPEAFEMALSDLPQGRYAMIGDTLHTDILGGQAAGLATILVTDHGLLAGQPHSGYITGSCIVPTYVLPAI